MRKPTIGKECILCHRIIHSIVLRHRNNADDMLML